MSEEGECYDNAVAESFCGTYKAELLADQPQRRFTSKAQAWALTADYIDNFYNPVRRHSTLGYKSPIAFELAHQVGAPGEIEITLIILSVLPGQVHTCCLQYREGFPASSAAAPDRAKG